VGAAIYGAIQLAGGIVNGDPDPKVMKMAVAGFAIGIAFGGFAGFAWTESALILMKRFGIDDWWGVSAALGVLCMPLMAPTVRRLAKWIDPK
jgi:hypothetical protein